MMREYEPRKPAGRVENYTNAFLWMAGFVLFMALFTLWAAYGYAAALVIAAFVRWGIALLPRRD